MMAALNTPKQQEASPIAPADARLLELEAENARLRSLVGELLVRNQQLREATASQEPAASPKL